jgi:HemY protein
MRGLILFLLVLIASVWLGVEFSQHPSYVLLAYRQWVIEVPLWLAMILLMTVILMLYFVLKVSVFFHHLNDGFLGWWRKRRSIKAYDKTQRGLLEMIEGRWSYAEKALIKGVDHGKNPVINYLVAAEAAFQQKEFDRSEKYLQKAYQAAPHEEVVIGLVQAKFQLEQGLFEQAHATVTRLYKIAPHHTAVLKLLERIYIRKGEWAQLLGLLPSLRKAKILDAQQYINFEKNVYCELIRTAQQKNEDIDTLRKIWHDMPAVIRSQPDILRHCIELLKEDVALAEEVEPVIRKVLRKKWDEDLVEVYGLLATSYPGKQLTIAESWLKQYGGKTTLFLVLARLCLRLQLWGKAKEYLEEGLRQEANREMQFELAKLYEQLGETKLALQYYKDGFELPSHH